MIAIEEQIDKLRGGFGNDILLAALILVAGFITAKIIHYIVWKQIRRLTQRTKTNVDDILLDVIEKPIEGVVIVSVIYMALLSIENFTPYRSNLSSIFFVCVVILSSHTVHSAISSIIPRWIRVTHKEQEKSPQLISRTISGAIYIVGLLIILDHFQIQITPIIAALGVGGLAVGLALQDSLTNFFAGVYIISSSPIRPGDFIEVPAEKVSGYIEDISWRSTRIRTGTHTLIIIPNSKISQSVVINTHLPEKEVNVLIEARVSYGSDLEKVEKIAQEVAEEVQKNVAGTVKTFKPQILFNAFADTGITFTIVMRAEENSLSSLIKHELIKKMYKKFAENGIGITSAIRSLVIEKPQKLEKK